MTARATIMNALLQVLAATGDFVTVSRRNRNPEGLGPNFTPALFLIGGSDDYVRTAANMPPKRVLNVKAIFYDDVGPDENLIPSDTIDAALDSLDAALAPNPGTGGKYTLGGLVDSVLIDGTVERAPGDVTGKSLAVVPLKITLP